MPTSAAIKAGRASVTVFTDTDPLTRGLKRSERMLGGFATSVGSMGAKLFGAGAAAAAPFAMATKTFMNQGDRLGKMAARTGLSIKSLSELEFSTSQSGSSLETLETGIRRFQSTIGDTSANTEVFDQFGIDLGRLTGMNPEAQLMSIADSIAAIEDPARKTAAANRLFGRSGTQLLPMLNQGSAGIRKLNAEAAALGLTMSEEDVAAAEQLTDAMDKTTRVVKRAAVSVGAALAPALITVGEKLASSASVAGKWIDQNRGMVVGAAAVAAGAMAAGTALLVVAGAAKVAAISIGVVGAVTAAIMSPLGLMTVGLVGMGVMAERHFGLTAIAAEKFGGVWGTLKTEATTAISGITAALSSGDMAAAAEIAWSMIQLQWVKGTSALSETWNGWKDGFQTVLADVTGLWTDFAHGLADIWDTVSDAFLDGVQAWQNDLAVGMAWAIGGEDAAREAEKMGQNDNRSDQRSKATAAAMAKRDADRRTLTTDQQEKADERAAAARVRADAAAARVTAARKKLEQTSAAAEDTAKAAEKEADKPSPFTPPESTTPEPKATTTQPTGPGGNDMTRRSGVAGRLAASSVVGRTDPIRGPDGDPALTRNADGSITPTSEVEKPPDPVPTLEEISGKVDTLTDAVNETAPEPAVPPKPAEVATITPGFVGDDLGVDTPPPPAPRPGMSSPAPTPIEPKRTPDQLAHSLIKPPDPPDITPPAPPAPPTPAEAVKPVVPPTPAEAVKPVVPPTPATVAQPSGFTNPGGASRFTSSSIVDRLTPSRIGGVNGDGRVNFNAADSATAGRPIAGINAPPNPIPTLEIISEKLSAVKSAVIESTPKHA